MKFFYIKIKETREAQELSILDASFIYDIEDKRLIMIESGEVSPTIEELIKISIKQEKPLSFYFDDELYLRDMNTKMFEIISLISEIEIRQKEIKRIMDNTIHQTKSNLPPVLPI